MGHVIEHHVLPKDCDRAMFIAQMDEQVSCEDRDEGGRYRASQLKWHENKVYDTREDAEKAIKRLDNGWYDDHAVLFRDTTGLDKTSKRLTTLEERLHKLQMDKAKYMSEHLAFSAKRKSAFMSCKKCGSRINLSYMDNARLPLTKQDGCPVCGETMTSQSVLDRIGSYDKRIADARKGIKAELRRIEARLAKKAKVCWLVKTEYHV